MKTETSNRYRISTRFTLVKVISRIVLFCMIGVIAWKLQHQSFRQENVLPSLAVVLLVAIILYYTSNQKIIEYDNSKQTLYVVDIKRQQEKTIPVENISKILYTGIGRYTGYYAYQVVYRNLQGSNEKLWLFPLPFSNQIVTVITDAGIKNPALITSPWGFNRSAFFDK